MKRWRPSLNNVAQQVRRRTAGDGVGDQGKGPSLIERTGGARASGRVAYERADGWHASERGRADGS